MCLGLDRKLCCMLVHNDYAVYTPNSPQHISATSRLLDEVALICSLFFIICFTELVTCISALFSQLNTIETMVMICLLTHRLRFRHVNCSVSIDKTNDACRFEKSYYLPSAANILLPCVTSSERISVAKIHLPDPFKYQGTYLAVQTRQFSFLVLHSFLIVLYSILSSETG